MILDALNEKVSLNRSTQICVVGGGLCGLLIARELSKVADVIVLESGGVDAELDTMALQVGESTGIDYPLMDTRTRQFGGSMSLWAGYCALFDTLDFEERSWVADSGWPFGMDTLAGYFPETARFLNLGEMDFDARRFSCSAGIDPILDDDSLELSVWRFGRPIVRIDEEDRSGFESNGAVTVLLHANVAELRLDEEHSRATEAVIRTLSGRQGRVHADVFVLACGGLETPRILLNCDAQVSHGFGNSGGMVGRCFMEHPHLCIDYLELRDSPKLHGWLDRVTIETGLDFLFCTGISDPVQREEEILNARCHVYRTPQMRDDEPPKAGIFLEQSPNPASRVTLADDRDVLGLRRLRLDWRLAESEWKTYRISARRFGAAFEKAGLGRVDKRHETDEVDTTAVLHSNHHLGTTRMSEDPSKGVVDADCRMHDYENVYIAGGSVFPTVSWANPTFILISLTLRLVDHLRDAVCRETGRVLTSGDSGIGQKAVLGG